MGSLKNIPVCWKDSDYKNLEYVSLGGYQTEQFHYYNNTSYKNLINNDVYSMPSPMPIFVDQVLAYFQYDIKAVALNKTPPGNILPFHKDLYTNFRKVYNINDISKITRFIIFLEDSKQGHIMEIEDNIFKNWKAGQYVSWKGDTPHGAYNLGTEDRYTLQITCANN